MTHAQTWALTRAFALLLMTAFLVSACGDSDDDSEADPVPDDDASDDDDTDDDAPDGAFTVVEIDPATWPTVNLAVHACAGLRNRQHGGSVYTVMSDKDVRWLDELDLGSGETMDAGAFLDACRSEFPCVRYSYADQQRLLPNILTVGAALGAVPLDEAIATACTDVAFDAVAEFADRDTPYLATKYVFENFIDDTAGWAMLNPGYETLEGNVANPALAHEMAPELVDYVFSEKLFVTFLVNGCVGQTQENDLLREIATSNPWPSPIGVYGYADYWMLFGGYLFESQTRCLGSRNMGAIPTKTTNLSFFSTRRAPIEEPGEVEQNAPEDVAYDPDNTYVAFVVGDGDNIAYMMDARGEWLRQRLADCRRAENSCAPITWSISPHLPRIAPDVLEWYYAMSRETGMDYFMLPPSGFLYAYPGSLNEDDQDAFASATERAARILDTDSTVHWEWWNTWRRAETEYLPRYARPDGVIRGVFPVNVPYMIPTFTWSDPDQSYKVIDGEDGGRVVLFRPREWRGIDDSGSGLTEDFYLNPERMAEKLGSLPRGTVAYVYMTSDGGLNLENSFMALVKILPEHVRLVSGGTAARLALEAEDLRTYAR